MWRIDCNFINGTEVKTVLVGAIRSGERWQTYLTRLAVTTLSCIDSISRLSVVCVDGLETVGRAIASVAVVTVPIVMRVFDLQ